jgi:glycosyltransferase involved in cell wall biosynthesis
VKRQTWAQIVVVAPALYTGGKGAPQERGRDCTCKTSNDTVNGHLNRHPSKEQKGPQPVSISQTPLVSILVPAYNAEATIERCLETVFAQSFTRYEVIIVNDCSTDSTREKVEHLEKKHRLTLVNHSENLGLPAARNTALKAAKGTYVMHLDADDYYLYRGLLADLVQVAEKDQCDILKFNGYNLVGHHKIKPLCNIERVTNRPYIHLFEQFGFNNVFSFMFRRKFVEREKLYFIEGINIGEDQIYLSSVLVKTARISCLPVYGYGYDKSVSSSLMRSQWDLRAFLEDHDAFAIVLKNLEKQDKRIINKTCMARMRYLYSKLSQASRHLDFRDFTQLINRWQATSAAMRSSIEETVDAGNMHDQQAADILMQAARNDASAIYKTLLEKPMVSSQQNPLESRNETSTVQLNIDALEQSASGQDYKEFRVFIHAGTHKTGSSSIQYMLWENRKELQSQGFYFPENLSLWDEPNTHQIPLALMPMTASIRHGFANVSIHTQMQCVFENARESGCFNIILSSEFFSPEQEDELPLDLKAFRDALMGAEVRFLFFFRNQVDRALSGYAQMVRATCLNLPDTFEQYIHQNDSCFDYATLLNSYQCIFGLQSVSAHFYDATTNCIDIFYNDFLKIDPGTFTKREIERHNKSHPLEDTLMLAYLNQRLSRIFSALPESDIAFIKSACLEYIKKNCVTTAIPDGIYTTCTQLRQRVKASNKQIMTMTGFDLDKACATALEQLRIKTTTGGTQNILNEDILIQFLTRQCLDNRSGPASFRQQGSKNHSRQLRAPRNKITSGLNFIQCRLNKSRNIEGIKAYNYRRKGFTKPGMTAMIRLKNESKNIEPMLNSIRGVFDEIVICDNNSTDDSVERIKAFQSSNPDMPIRFYSYPFEVARCGHEHRETDEHSIHSLCYFYNWCLSKCTHQYVCKWDADMIFSRSKINSFIDIKNKLNKYRNYHLSTLNGQTIYIGKTGKKYKFKEDIHNEVRIFPNTTYVHFGKGHHWEYIKSYKKIRTLNPKDTFFYEIKDTNINEFDHWSTKYPEHMSVRKKAEYRNYMQIKSLAPGQDLGHSISEITELS